MGLEMYRTPTTPNFEKCCCTEAIQRWWPKYFQKVLRQQYSPSEYCPINQTTTETLSPHTFLTLELGVCVWLIPVTSLKPAIRHSHSLCTIIGQWCRGNKSQGLNFCPAFCHFSHLWVQHYKYLPEETVRNCAALSLNVSDIASLRLSDGRFFTPPSSVAIRQGL